MSKASRYNYFLKHHDDFYYGYNFLYRSLIKIPAETYPEILQLLKNPNDHAPSKDDEEREAWLKALESSRFLIDDHLSEIDLIKNNYYKSLYASDILRLTVLPTLQCNLDCPYCYEHKKPGFLSQEVENALMEWIEREHKDKRYIHLSWFGGEPLLGTDIIERITQRIQSFCNRIQAHFSASMTTNGALMNHDFISKIPQLGIQHIQITFDGDQKHHDQLKKSPDGKGSFNEILENALSFCDMTTEEQCRFTVRVNCTDGNAESMENLLRTIPEKIRTRATFFFRWISDNEASSARGFDHFSAATHGKDPFVGLEALNTKAKALGYRVVDPHTSRNANYCEADFRDQFFIYPDGSVFLCHHMSDPKEALFHLLDKTPQEKDLARQGAYLARWMTTGPFEEKKCLACQLLPLCLGGCRKRRAEGNPHCLAGKSTLPFFVKNIIDRKIAHRAKTT